MFNSLVNRFSPLATLYNRLVVVKSAAASGYYYDAHQIEQNTKTFHYNLCAGVNQDLLIVTDTTTEKSIMTDHVDDDFCIVGADFGDSSVATIPSVNNDLPFYSSSSNMVNYAYHAASTVAENTTGTAICGAVRSWYFAWPEKKHIEEFVQEKAKKFAQPKMRGFGVDFANVPSIKFNLAGSSYSSATTAA